MNKSSQFLFVFIVVIVGGISYYLGQRAPQNEGDAQVRQDTHYAMVPEEGLNSAAQTTLATALPNSESAGKSGATPDSRFTHFRVGNRNVKSIFVEDNIVWVGTSGGVIRYEEATDDYRLFDVRNGLLANGVFYVGRIKGRLCVGTYGGGFALYDEIQDKFDIYNVPDGLADAFVYDMLEMPSGDVWIATWSGANRVLDGDFANPDKWETYTVENTRSGLPNDWVYGLDLGINGEVWFATEGGLARFHNGVWDNWAHPDGLGAPYDLVKADNAFDSDPAAISSHHARQKVEMNLQHVNTAYNPNYIVALEVDHKGVVWVGTWGGGLGRFDGANWTNFTVKDGLPSNHVFMLHEDAARELWIGTSDGLAQQTQDGYRILTIENGLFANTIFSMSTDAETLWVGSYGGLARIKQ